MPWSPTRREKPPTSKELFDPQQDINRSSGLSGAPFDATRWNLSQAATDLSLTTSQLSIATTTEASIFDSSEEEDNAMRNEVRSSLRHSSARNGIPVDEEHDSFVLMYDMLTGIRIGVSRCEAKPDRPLVDRDFKTIQQLSFDVTGNEGTPSSKHEFKFKDYSPWVFRCLRKAFHIDAADYLVSLTGRYVLSELGSPGKSGSFFYFSQDYRFIIKTIRHNEHVFLRQILRYYYEHMQRHKDSLLSRFFGLHRVRLPRGRKIYFVVMGNINPPHRDIHELYDLKGSTLGRETPIGDEDPISVAGTVVLKDLNWLNSRRRLMLGPEKATLLMRQLRTDCQFLARLRIMDYSLLVGIHDLVRGNSDRLRTRTLTVFEPTDDGHLAFRTTTALEPLVTMPEERRMSTFYHDDGGFQSTFSDNTVAGEIYYLGIIDILTPYKTAKKFEHFFKSIRYNQQSISAVNPIVYRNRFLQFMDANILQDQSADYSIRALPPPPPPGGEEIGGMHSQDVNNNSSSSTNRRNSLPCSELDLDPIIEDDRSIRSENNALPLRTR